MMLMGETGHFRKTNNTEDIAMKGNVIVGQSGGPTAAINSSLAGVYRTAKDRGAKKRSRCSLPKNASHKYR